MIHGIEDKTRRELVEIAKIQVEEYQKLQAELEKAKKSNSHAGLREALQKAQAELEAVKRERDELTNNFEQQLAKEAGSYVSLSNAVVGGEYYGKHVGGSILNERVYVENRIKDIKEPLFVSARKRLEILKLEQQAIALENLANRICPVSGQVIQDPEARSIMFDEANALREQAKGVDDE